MLEKVVFSILHDVKEQLSLSSEKESLEGCKAKKFKTHFEFMKMFSTL